MLNKVVTIDQVLSWDVCYDKEKILRLSHGKTELTVGEIINLRFVPAVDKFWLLLREEIIPARILHEFAIWCAETALTKANETDERSWNALQVKRLWLDGKATDEEMAAARVAAMDAASAATWDDAKDAARYAASADARYAAWDAAKYAARAVARYATWDAAIDTARDAARVVARVVAMDAQLTKLKEMLEGTSL